MRFVLLLFCSQFLNFSSLTAQVQGCMDTKASNYNANATINNGSCAYASSDVALKNSKKATLPTTINEISGIIYFNGKLYGHNDSGGQPAIYEIDTSTGIITKTITLQGASNVDWEDITQDDENIYVGDFGNNESGNRTDLIVYKFPKADIQNSAGIDITIPSSDINLIRFKYEDQNDFTEKQPNSTNFDCEAFFCDNGQLHLFTKNWIGNFTVHYVLDANKYSGVQTAIRKDSFNTQGTLITAATLLNDKTVLLLGYEVTGIPSGNLWIISDFNDVNQLFATGNKRKVGLGYIVDDTTSGIGQIEGLAMAGNERVFITCEYFTRTFAGLNFTIPQTLYGLTVTDWLPEYAGPVTSAGFSWKVSPSPFSDKLQLDIFCENDQQVKVTLHDLLGRELISKKLICSKGENKCELNDLSALNKAIYVVAAKSPDGLLVKKVMKE